MNCAPSSISRGNDLLRGYALYPQVGLLLSVKVHMSQPQKHTTVSMIPFKKISCCPKQDSDLALTLCFGLVNICC